MKKTTMDRRKFLRSSAMAAAVAAVQQRALGAASDALLPPSTISWDKAPCRFCGTGCHVKVGVENGKVVAIKGHEQAGVNQGLLCVKGYHVGGILYGEDRLTQPLIRRDGKLVSISWDGAITTIAERIAKNPKGFAFYGSGQWTVPEGYVAQKLMKGGLSNNHIEPNARLCMASAVTGFISTYGVDEPAGCYDDLDACDVVITWGNNPAEMHPVLFSRMIDRRSKGEKLTLIDLGTRRTRTTEFADHYLEFQPQSDLAIANCIAQQLIANDTYDKQFVEKFCAFRADPDPSSLLGKPIDFEAYKKAVATYTPEYTAKISGLSVEQLKMLGDLFGKRDVKITSLWCMGMNQHTRGTAINRLVHGIHLLSGHFGKPGDAPTSLTGQPSACGTAREVGTLAHALPGGRLVAKEDHRKYCEDHWNLPPGRINAKPGYHTVLMWEKFCTPTAEGGDIDTMFVQVTNPGQSLPNLNKLYKAKEGLEDKFLIVSDVYPTASTELADLVLPASMWVEKNGVYGNSERRTQQWFKMVDPPGQARDDTWMTIAIARKLYEMGVEGMRDKDGRFLFHLEGPNGASYPCWDWDRYYSEDFNVDRALYEDYRVMTTAKHKDVAPYDELVKTQGMRWPVVQQADGSWRETRFRFSEFDDPYVEKGKEIQFYHSTTKDDRAQIWFCAYEAPPEIPDNDYPFWLCTGRVLEHWHTGSMTMRIPELQGAMPHAYVELHAEDAKDQGLGNGDIALLKTRRGEMKLPVWTDGRGNPPRGSVFVPFFDETLLINDLTLHDFCPVSKEPDYKKCAVSISKASPA